MPAVSIVLTSYNYGRYIDDAIASVVAQTWTDWELVVVDDGSTDDSLARIARWAARDGRVRLLRHADGANHGLAASLGLGIQAAGAPLVAFLESDDAWRGDCLERRLRAFSRYDADVVFNTAEPVPVGTCSVRRIRRYLRNVHLRFGATGPVSLGPWIWLGNPVPSFSCAMVRRRLLACDMTSPEPAWLDWWLWLQLASRARFVYLDAPLTRWRVHADSYGASVTGVAARKGRMLRGCRMHDPRNRPAWLPSAPFLGLAHGAALCLLRLRRALL